MAKTGWELTKVQKWGALYSAGARYSAGEIAWHNLDLYRAGAALFGAPLYSAGLVPLQTLYSAGSDVTPL